LSIWINKTKGDAMINGISTETTVLLLLLSLCMTIVFYYFVDDTEFL